MSTSAKNTSSTTEKHGLIDIIKHRWIYIGISLVFLIPGTIYIIMNMMNPEIKAPVRLGIDFTGGTMLEYGFQKKVTETDLPAIRELFTEMGKSGAVVQIQGPRAGVTEKAIEIGQANEKSEELKSQDKKPTADSKKDTATKAGPAQAGDIESIVFIRSKHLSPDEQIKVNEALTQKFGEITPLQNFSIGPSLASELLKNGFIALLLAYILIVGYLTFRFEFDYAVCAIIALVHDALFVFGIFALLGHFYHTEVDSMFITSILTVIGFSVHDTIVVFDRLRENTKVYYTKKLPFSEIANISVNQTLGRSINTSMTALITLLALFLFGGETTKDFVFACLLGIAVGTYSSIFVASAMLTWWREIQSKRPAMA